MQSSVVMPVARKCTHPVPTCLIGDALQPAHKKNMRISSLNDSLLYLYSGLLPLEYAVGGGVLIGIFSLGLVFLNDQAEDSGFEPWTSRSFPAKKVH